MLKNTSPLRTPGAQHLLASWSRGHELAVVDEKLSTADFARHGSARTVQLCGANALSALRAELQAQRLDDPGPPHPYGNIVFCSGMVARD
jgi:L-fucose mutarotase/ribose pyranase (RbsD/FucU family)